MACRSAVPVCCISKKSHANTSSLEGSHTHASTGKRCLPPRAYACYISRAGVYSRFSFGRGQTHVSPPGVDKAYAFTSNRCMPPCTFHLLHLQERATPMHPLLLEEGDKAHAFPTAEEDDQTQASPLAPEGRSPRLPSRRKPSTFLPSRSSEGSSLHLPFN